MATPQPSPLVVQLSDIHIGSRLADGGRSAGAVLTAALDAVEALGARVDLLLLTGDLTDHGSPAEYDELFSVLDRWKGPTALITGNHDDPEELRARVAGRLPVAADVPGLCWALDVGPLRVVGLDSCVPGRDGGRLGPERLAWLDGQLAAHDRPTIVAVHHPPAPIGHGILDTMYLDDGDALGDIVERHPHVERIVCGHTHRAVSMGWRGTVVSVAPSSIRAFSPMFAAGARLTLTGEQPGFAVHAWVEGTLATHVLGFDAAGAAPRVAGTT